MKLLVVVPARGGSKRIPQKNIALLCGKPLLFYTLDCIRMTGLIDVAVVSTEDPLVAKVATDMGVQVMSRPAELANDTTSTEEVLLDALKQWAMKNRTMPEWVMTLPPTSPMRSSITVTKFLDRLETVPADVDCIMSTTENRGDFWRYEPDGKFCRLFPQAPRRQQERTPLFEENSAIYVTRVSALHKTGSILGSKVYGLTISPIEGLDINTQADMRLAEALLPMLWNNSVPAEEI